MNLSSRILAAAYKKLVAVDLPSSKQHELNGVGALKSLFGTAGSTEGEIQWRFFGDGLPTVSARAQFKFYDARAKGSEKTGRSEWRFYYHGNFLGHADVGDLLILVKTTSQEIFGLIFRKGSDTYADACELFGLKGSNSSFDYIPQGEFERRELITNPSSQFQNWLHATFSELVHEDAAPEGLGLVFKPRARILILLGDQLIRDAGIAVFELVKNAYDADASSVHVTLHHITDRNRAMVIVEDDGCGMTIDDIVNIWLEPGTDYRQKQKATGFRSPVFNRLPLGEKGVGRFAAHKIGKKIRLISRKLGFDEAVVEIDWNVFDTEKYLSDAKVIVTQRKPQHFQGESSGTRLEISDLNEDLSRGTVRQISRSITSICSPFRGPSEFVAELELIPANNLLAGLLDIHSVAEMAPYKATCLIDDERLSYDYEFSPPAQLERIAGRRISKEMVLPQKDLFTSGMLNDLIGPILVEFRIYDLDNQVMAYAVSDKRGFKDFLKQNGGVRVYRDGVRIYDYGEPGNDWLDLGGSRVNNPTAKVSNNQIIAAVHLEGARSKGLVEKTNREGFIEDGAYELLVSTLQFCLKQVVFERNLDKNRLRQIYSSKRFKQPVLEELAELRAAIEKYPDAAAEIKPMIIRVEAQYLEMRETLITAAGAGLTLSVVIHEVEKAIKGLSIAITRKANMDELRELSDHVNELIEGLTYLTRKSGRQNESFRQLVHQTTRNINYRIRAHKITLVNGIENGDPDVSVRCTRRLIIATLMNLVDNSIYWLSTKGGAGGSILIGSTTDIEGGPVLFVADTGPGFADYPEDLIQPFMSRRPEGMGLGLHIADSIMRAHDGKLIFPSKEELGLSDIFTGAIVGLQFKI